MVAIDNILLQTFKYGKPSKNKLYKVLKISKSTVRFRNTQTTSKMELKRNMLMNQIETIFYDFKEIYGAPKIHAELHKRNSGTNISIKTVSNYMRKMSLRSITITKFKKIILDETKLSFDIPLVNYIKEDRPICPGTHILTDITYIYTVKDDWVYLLSFMDMYTRKIIAWSINNTMTSDWVTKVTMEAIKKYPNIIYIHSDRGSQYTSKIYLSLLLENKISPSFSAKGYPYHNAWIESFHAQLKKECIYRTSLKDFDHAKETCYRYIEHFYNKIRSQKSLSYLSPIKFEEEFYTKLIDLKYSSNEELKVKKESSILHKVG